MKFYYNLRDTVHIYMYYKDKKVDEFPIRARVIS